MARVPARPEGPSPRLAFTGAMYKNDVPAAVRWEWNNLKNLGSSNRAETKVETVNKIRNIFDARMHCNTAVLSRIVASAGE
jgi:hypothetical protein